MLAVIFGGGVERNQTHINKHVLPQAPSPTMTSLRLISAILAVDCELFVEGRLDDFARVSVDDSKKVVDNGWSWMLEIKR